MAENRRILGIDGGGGGFLYNQKLGKCTPGFFFEEDVLRELSGPGKRGEAQQDLREPQHGRHVMAEDGH